MSQGNQPQHTPPAEVPRRRGPPGGGVGARNPVRAGQVALALVEDAAGSIAPPDVEVVESVRCGDRLEERA
jgi:hypothetical protein